MALSLITPEKLLRLYIGSAKQNLAYAGQVVQVLCMGKFFIYMFVDGIELADKLLWRLQTKLQRQRRTYVWVRFDERDVLRYILTGISDSHVRLVADDTQPCPNPPHLN